MNVLEEPLEAPVVDGLFVAEDAVVVRRSSGDVLGLQVEFPDAQLAGLERETEAFFAVTERRFGRLSLRDVLEVDRQSRFGRVDDVAVPRIVWRRRSRLRAVA